jgi:hypothetical protein
LSEVRVKRLSVRAAYGSLCWGGEPDQIRAERVIDAHAGVYVGGVAVPVEGQQLGVAEKAATRRAPAYAVCGSCRVPITRIGLRVDAFHGPL